MKAAVMSAAGQAPAYQDFPDPEPREGREILDLVAAALHPVARSQAEGRHYSSSGVWPLIPGVDAVARNHDGALVYLGGVEPPYGTFAERISVPAGMYLPLPEGADPVAIAAGINPGMSSWMPLTTHIKEHRIPQIVLVIGATGAAGGLAVQNALALEAGQVIAIGRGAADLERVAALGAETVPLTGDVDTDAAAVGRALAGRTPDLVLDYLWGGPAEAVLRAVEALPDAGYTGHVQIGSLAGGTAAIPAALLRSRPYRLTGSGIGSFPMLDYLGQIPTCMQLITDKRVDIATQPYPLTRVSDAWTAPNSPRAVLIPG
jgi:NADPH:quinone reductase-like Zn-dependent oxidoreductase